MGREYFGPKYHPPFFAIKGAARRLALLPCRGIGSGERELQWALIKRASACLLEIEERFIADGAALNNEHKPEIFYLALGVTADLGIYVFGTTSPQDPRWRHLPNLSINVQSGNP